MARYRVQVEFELDTEDDAPAPGQLANKVKGAWMLVGMRGTFMDLTSWRYVTAAQVRAKRLASKGAEA